MGYNELRMLIGQNESILWEGKPDKKCFILESVFNAMLPFALLWALIDGTLIMNTLLGDSSEFSGGMGLFILLFFTIHLMPVWIYLFGVISSMLRYKNTYYIITDRGLYSSSGVISCTTDVKMFAEMSNVALHRGVFDKMIGVGDVVVISETSGYNTVRYGTMSRGNVRASGNFTIKDIRDYERVFKIVKDVQTDVYADTMYPNALRPESNPGYNTKYSGRQDW